MNEEDKLSEMLESSTKQIISLNPDPVTLIDFIQHLATIVNKHIAFKNLTFQALEDKYGYSIDESKLLESLKAAVENKQH